MQSRTPNPTESKHRTHIGVAIAGPGARIVGVDHLTTAAPLAAAANGEGDR